MIRPVDKLTDNARETAVTTKTCPRPPFGCGRPIDAAAFRDPLSVVEYRISGLCQVCQDKVFSEVDEEEAERRVAESEHGADIGIVSGEEKS